MLTGPSNEALDLLADAEVVNRAMPSWMLPSVLVSLICVCTSYGGRVQGPNPRSATPTHLINLTKSLLLAVLL